MRHIPVPTFLAAVLIAVPVTSAGAQSARKSTSSDKTSVGSTAGAWHAVFDDTAVSLSVDTVQTRRLADGTFNARLRWRYSADRPIGRNESYRTMVERRMVDCASLGSKPLSAQTYDAAGKPVSHFTTPASDVKYLDWAVRKPGSSSANAYAALCRSLKK